MFDLQLINELNGITDAYASIVRDTSIDKIDIPNNLAVESERVRVAFEAGRSHDPVFSYADTGDLRQSEVATLRRRCDALGDTPWVSPIRLTLDYIQLTAESVQTRSASDITDRTTFAYGRPKAALIAEARSELAEEVVVLEEDEAFNADAVCAVVMRALASVGLTEWTCEPSDRMSAIMDVSAEHRQIRVRVASMFSRGAIVRLLAHEVGVHVFRSASGGRQPLRMLGLGLGDYLPTEEGLACVMEERTGCADPVDYRRLPLRYVAASLALDQGFFDVYTALREYAEHSQAFETAARAKRGMIHTAEPGSHLKDSVYYSGFKDVEAHLQSFPEDLTGLYVGKIPLSLLPPVNKALASGDLSPPAFDHRAAQRLVADV